MINSDSGLNAEWIRIVKIVREEKVSVEEAKNIFLKRYKERFGKDYKIVSDEEGE